MSDKSDRSDSPDKFGARDKTSNPANESRRDGNIAAAWLVHALTASGALIGVLALAEIRHQHWTHFFWWLVAATAIDSCDGFLARKFRVKEVLPSIDGALLDNVVDYFTYVLVPAVFVVESGLFSGTGAFVAAGLMVFSSAYQFCQVDAKTDDRYFKGWPSYWNIVALYLFLLDWGPRANVTIVVVCAVLVFVPVKYLYPSRTKRFRGITMALTALWVISMMLILWRHPAPSRWLLWASLLYVGYYTAASVWITAQDARMQSGTNDSLRQV
jgi:phosphatidylcholine synthase